MDFMRIFMDDFSVFGDQSNHLDHLQKCLERCRMFKMALSPYKCAIVVQRGKLLVHIIFKEGMSIAKEKICAIQKSEAPDSVKGVLRVVGQVK